MRKNIGIKKKNIGFTLLELIIAIVILGILASLAIPRYFNVAEQERGEACIYNMRLIATAWEIYNMRNATPYANNPDIVFCPIDTINSDLGIGITENYFGQSSDGQRGYFLDYDPPSLGEDYQIMGERLSGNYQGNNIIYSSSSPQPWGGAWFVGFPPDPPSFPVPED